MTGCSGRSRPYLGDAPFTETPVVIVDVQRAGPCTGQATGVGAESL